MIKTQRDDVERDASPSETLEPEDDHLKEDSTSTGAGLSEDQRATSELRGHAEPFSEVLTPQLIAPEALPHTDSELHVSTGVFQAPPTKRHISLSVALVGAIAFVVFVTLNPDILAQLFTPKPQATSSPSIQLGSQLGQIRYRLESSPKGATIKCKGEQIGTTRIVYKR